jgi:hypothetical protein
MVNGDFMNQLEVNYIPRGIKTIFIAIMLVIVSFSFIANAYEKQTDEIIKLNYNFKNPSINTIDIEGTIYDRIILEDCYTAGNAGEPNIPSKGVFILLPPNRDVEKINIISNKKINLNLNNEIDPISKPIPIKDIKKSITPIKNEIVYQKNDIYPGKLHSFVGIHSFRGYNILVLLLHPMQYNPVTKELFYYENLEVNVKTKQKNNVGLYRGFESDKTELIEKVDNPEMVQTYEDFETNPSPRDDYDLLILTTESLKSGFESLKNAHNTNGFSTIIKTLADVGSTDQEDIRQYIKDAYLNMGVNYVLLGGDYDVFPTRTLWVYGLDEETTPYETYMPSDLYYSCLDGPYNYDGDSKWGEPEDGEDGGDVDLMADVYVGRACVDDSSDVDNFVTKTVSYINKDPENPYLKETCLAGEYMGNYGIATWGGNYMDQLIDECTDDGYTTNCIPSNNYTITKLYDRDWPGNDWPASEMMNVIDSGTHFINHLGHASYGYNMKMDSSAVYSLSNDEYCFIYSQGCMAGGFDDPYGYDCFAEYFTVKTDTGAFAGIWNARYGWFWSYSTDGDSQRFHREYWDAVFGEEIPQIGRANSDSKEDNLPIIGRSCIRWCYYQTNLFGDPSLEFYELEENQPPETPEIDGPETGKVGIEYTYEFTMIDPDDEYLYIMVDWDDGTPVEWDGPYGPGNLLTLKHIWDEKGTYQIKAKLKDLEGEESDWGTFNVFITKIKNKETNQWVFRLFERFQIIRQILQRL